MPIAAINRNFSLTKPPLGATIDSAHPLGLGIIGCWMLNAGAGRTAHDLSHYANHGTFQNNATWAPGRAGPCFQGSGGADFGGTADYIVIPHASHYAGWPGFSLCQWVKNRNATIGATGNEVPSSKRGIGADTWNCYWQSTEDVGFVVSTTSGAATAEMVDGITSAEWHHIVGTWDGVTVRVYVDGVVGGITAALGGTLLSSVHNILIGEDGDSPGSEWNGWIDQLTLWNRGLSVEEVRQLYVEPYCFLK